MPAQGGLTIERMCQLGQVSRAGFYRHWQRHEPRRRRRWRCGPRIQQIVLQHRGRYGYRRVSWELRHQGLAVNHKRVLRLMQRGPTPGSAAAQVRAHHGSAA